MAFDFGLGDIFQGIGTLFGIGSQIEEQRYQRELDAWNKEQYIENRDYTRALQQTMFDREDTAYQRAVDDAQSAGLSPLAITGGSSAGAVVSSPSASVSSGSRSPDYLTAVSNLMSLRNAARMTDAQVERLEEQSNIDWYKAKTERAKADSDIKLGQQNYELNSKIADWNREIAEDNLDAKRWRDREDIRLQGEKLLQDLNIFKDDLNFRKEEGQRNRVWQSTEAKLRHLDDKELLNLQHNLEEMKIDEIRFEKTGDWVFDGLNFLLQLISSFTSGRRPKFGR